MLHEEKLDIWKVANSTSAVCITTNGNIKANGHAVMGAGIAKSAVQNYPGIDLILAEKLTKCGNHVCIIQENDLLKPMLIAFPTKYNWQDPSSIPLIVQSCQELKALITRIARADMMYYLPRPGCANGQLGWETQVKLIVEELLGDIKNLIIISR